MNKYLVIILILIMSFFVFGEDNNLTINRERLIKNFMQKFSDDIERLKDKYPDELGRSNEILFQFVDFSYVDYRAVACWDFYWWPALDIRCVGTGVIAGIDKNPQLVKEVQTLFNDCMEEMKKTEENVDKEAIVKKLIELYPNTQDENQWNGRQSKTALIYRIGLLNHPIAIDFICEQIKKHDEYETEWLSTLTSLEMWPEMRSSGAPRFGSYPGYRDNRIPQILLQEWKGLNEEQKLKLKKIYISVIHFQTFQYYIDSMEEVKEWWDKNEKTNDDERRKMAFGELKHILQKTIDKDKRYEYLTRYRLLFGKDSGEGLLLALDDSSDKIIDYAITVLGIIKYKEAKERIKTFLSSANSEIRKSAEWSLKQLDGK